MNASKKPEKASKKEVSRKVEKPDVEMKVDEPIKEKP